METTSSGSAREVEILRQNAGATHRIVKLNLEGITQEDSLIQPRPAGNCLNWVVGHLLNTYNQILPLLGQQPVMEKGALSRYARGAGPLQNSEGALALSALMAAWDLAASRVDAGLASLTPSVLDAPAPMSPRNDPNETVRSLLALVTFHQAYHAGQTGILRRMAGKEGALA